MFGASVANVTRLARVQTICARQLSLSSVRGSVIKNVTVVGGGLMGSGIVQVAAQTGHSVTLVDISEQCLQRSKQNIDKSLQRVAKKLHKDDQAAADNFIKTTLDRVTMATSIESQLAQCDLVIEAIVEDLAVKRKLFTELDQKAPKKTIFTSNTSSIPISRIADATSRPDRFGGLHFFNPVPVMKLLEVVSVAGTSQTTLDAMMSFGAAMGKTTVRCKDTPGFIVNRILVPSMMEAVRMLERGDATARDIDTAMKLGASNPMGPFELADYVGLDTVKFILDGWHRDDPDNSLFQPSPLLDKMVAEGKLGMKSGRGFYEYPAK